MHGIDTIQQIVFHFFHENTASSNFMSFYRELIRVKVWREWCGPGSIGAQNKVGPETKLASLS